MSVSAETNGANSGNQSTFPVKQCHCGRGPRRRGQRNCDLCNRAANAAYRARQKLKLKKAEALIKSHRLKAMAEGMK